MASDAFNRFFDTYKEKGINEAIKPLIKNKNNSPATPTATPKNAGGLLGNIAAKAQGIEYKPVQGPDFKEYKSLTASLNKRSDEFKKNAEEQNNKNWESALKKEYGSAIGPLLSGMSFGLGAAEGESGGLFSWNEKKLDEKFGTNNVAKSKAIQDLNPISSGLGTMAGWLLPGAGANKALSATSFGKSLLPKAGEGLIQGIANTGIKKLATAGAIEGGMVGALQGLTESQRDNKPILPTVANRVGESALFGGLTGGLFGGIGKGLNKANTAVNRSIDNTVDSMANRLKPNLGSSDAINKMPSNTKINNLSINTLRYNPPQSPIKIEKPTGSTFTIKNTRVLQAEQELQDAFETLRNKYRTSDIQGAISDIVNDYAPPMQRKISVDMNYVKNYVKQNDGIDLDALEKNIDDATNRKPIPSSDELRMRRAAGVADDKSYEINKKLIDYNKAPKTLRERLGLKENTEAVDNIKTQSNIQTPSTQNKPLKTQNTANNKVELSNDITPNTNNFGKDINVGTKSQRELPEVYNMTRQQFDSHYGLDKKPSRQSVENIVEDIGARIINKTGINDIPSLVNYYKKKYDLPDNIKVDFNITKSTVKGKTTPIRDANGNMTGASISINPNQSIEGKIGSLRHEIEHVIDLKSGYAPSGNKYKFNPRTDKTGRALYENSSKGHHKNYGWFEADYLRRAEIKDALKSGKQIPKEVLDEFPDLKNVKPVKNAEVTSNKTMSTTEVDAVSEPSTNNVNVQEKQSKPVKSVKTKTEQVKTEQTKNEGENKKFKVFDLDETGAEKERGFSRNVRTDENMSDDIRKSLDESPETYNQLRNEETLKSAEEKFSQGYEKALRDFQNSDNLKADDVPLSRMLANEAAKRGDIKTAREVIAKMAEKLTDAGRLSQAAKILRKSDPSALVEFLERKVIKLNEQGKKLYGKKWKDIKLPNERVKEIYNLELFDEAAIERQMNRALNELSEQLPVTKLEKFDEWRRMVMLLNPKTHIRNITGNTLMMMLRKTSDTIGAGLEKAFLKGNRTKSIGWSTNKNIVNKVDESWNVNKDDLMSNGKYEVEINLNVMNRDKRIFDNNVLEKMRQFSKNTLEGEDQFFMERAYKDALGQYMKANKLTEVTEKAYEYAKRRALEATFRQANALASLIIKGKKLPFAGKIIDAAIPFVKTPTNIAKSAFEYSPAGLFKALYTKVKYKDTAMAIEDLSKGMTGSAMLGVGYLLSSIGWARGDISKSRNAEGLMNISGDQPYSIMTPLGSYTFDWAQPFAVPMAMGIAFNEALKRNTNPDKSIALDKAIADSIYAGGDALFGMTMVSNIRDLLGGKYGSPAEAIASLPESYLQQAIPTLLGQGTRLIDNTKRNTYDPSILKTMGNRFIAKTPYASKTLEPKLDAFGNEQKYADTTVVNVVQQLFSPGTYKSKNNSKVIAELNKLYDKTKDTEFLPKVAPKYFTYKNKTIRMSPKEITEFQRVMGKLNETSLRDAIESDDYVSSETNEEKIKILKEVVEDSREQAKERILQKRGLLESQ